jgi:hypothetical protein
MNHSREVHHGGGGRRRHPRALFATLLHLLLLPVGVGGCVHVGPHTVGQDRFDYTDAIANSWKQQMLVNIVKLRYGDTPVFLDVASVINQYQLGGQVNATLNWNPPIGLNNSQSAGGVLQYAERPTITYAPLSGERFARSLMKPLPAPSVMSLIEAGYPIDVVLRVCVNGVNGVRNRYGGLARAQMADPEFYPLLERLRKLQMSGRVGLRIDKQGETEGVVLVFRKSTTAELDADTLFVRKTLGLDPQAQSFRIAYGSVAKDDQEIALQSRSVLEILIELGSYIDVPALDVQEKRVVATAPQETRTDNGAAVPPLIRIQSSPARPEHGGSFIEVPYRGHWFWIDDRDMRSKSLFTFLMFIFSLTETGGKEGAPIVTIPAG